MNTSREPCGRYQIYRHDTLPAEHQASYRARGINPDDLWSLVWSFHTMEAAEKMLIEEREDARPYSMFKIVDKGEDWPGYIERVDY